MSVDIYLLYSHTVTYLCIGVKTNCTMFNSDYYIAIIVVGYNYY